MKKRISKKRRKQAQYMTQPYLAKADNLPKGYEDHYPFKPGETVLVLGEIEGMPGHCAIALNDGRVLFAYHTDNFRKLTGEEL